MEHPDRHILLSEAIINEKTCYVWESLEGAADEGGERWSWKSICAALTPAPRDVFSLSAPK